MAIKGKPDVQQRKLLGCDHFVRHNPRSDLFDVRRFHHLEFYAMDATSTSKRCVKQLRWHQARMEFCHNLRSQALMYHLLAEPLCRLQIGLGMTLVAKSDLSTENSACVSHVIKCNDVVFVVTAPQAPHMVEEDSNCALPGYDADEAFAFLSRHGLAVRAIGASSNHR
jgi:4-hydroxyphenylpyruvate dioxygenase